MARERQVFAVGDVHGCANELRTVLNKLPLHPDCTIVFLGDYIDRGPQSREVVDTILELSKSYEVIPLMGNHESMLLKFIADPESEDAAMFIYNGGSATLASYRTGPDEYHIPEDHLEFYRTLRLSYETEDYFFVHAGFPDVPLAQLDVGEHAQAMLWLRGSFRTSTYAWSKRIVHGHTPVREVVFRPNRINVDTGCVYDGKLSVVELPTESVYSVAKAERARHTWLRDESSRRVATRFEGVAPVYVHRGDITLEFETLNYSEFGMFMRDILHPEAAVFEEGDTIEGAIGSRDHYLVEFEGQVVRVVKKDDGVYYAVQIPEPRFAEED